MDWLTGFLFGFSIVLSAVSLVNYRHSRRARQDARAKYGRANATHKKANQAYEEAVRIKTQAEQAFAKANRFLTYQNMN